MIFLLFSCNSDNQSAFDEMPLIYPAPKKVFLNTVGGYIINPTTGDSIQPIVNSLGDTVKTGVPLPANGKSIHPDSVVLPKIVPAAKPEVVFANLNAYKIPETLTVISVNKNSLKTFTPGVDTSSFVLFNSTGDTVPTGVPITVKGKVVPCLQSQPVKALAPRMNDNASINMKYLNVAEGMNSSYVMSMLEDSRGNLWFGTGLGGVSVYNSETFTHFTEKEGLSNDIVNSILEDRHGNLWFGTWRGGLSMYNGETFTHFTEKEGLSNNNVRSILEDSHGNLWFGTGGGGVSKSNGKTFMHFTVKEGLSNNSVVSILEDRQGNLWFGTEGGGVSMYNGETFTHFTENDGLSNNYVLSILEDSHGNLWFGTGGGGVSLYNGETFTHFTEKEGLSHNIVRSILEDSHGNLWFGTGGGGVSRYNGETFTYFTEKEGLSHNDVSAVLEDRHGNLWFGTFGGGVSMSNGITFKHFTVKEGLSNNYIYSILEDRHGNLWFGTLYNGVSMYNGKTFTHFTEDKGLSNNVVQSIIEDSHGNLWFGTAGGGVSKYNGETFTHFTEKEGLSYNDVWCILEDRHGNLWFGTIGGGLSMYDGASFTNFTDKEGLSNNNVFSILEDRQGNLWFGTWDGGVSKYDGKTFTHYTEKEGLSNNWVMSILEDSHGNLWFGTRNGGVSKYDGKTFTQFTEKEGLIDNTIQSIIEDSSSNIWLGTEKGLSRIVFDPESDSNSRYSLSASGVKADSVDVASINPVIYTYVEQDGLKGINFYPNSALLDSKNRIWWGSGQSLTMLDMNNFRIPVEPPAMVLNRIEINEQFVDYRHLKDSAGMNMEFNGVSKFNNYPLNLELPYNRNHLTFYFSAIDWSAPHKIRYSYKMEGLNDYWSLPTAEAKADYRNLTHGTYTFKVRAFGSAQKWSKPFDYTFTINPPWWHTWWARTGYAITALLIIFGFVRLRTANLKQRQKELEAEVDNATLKIRAQKEEVESQRDEIQRTQSQLVQSEKMASVGVLTAGIAHELNNPINFVSGNVNPLLRDVNDVITIIEKYDEIVKSNKLEGAFGEVDDLKDKMDYSFLIKEIINLLAGIEDGANRSSQIVKGLRSFSRLDEEKPQLYDIHEGIDSSLILLQNKMKKRIEVLKDYGDLSEIECFPSKLNQVIMNILANSIQAIEDRGEIFIQTISSSTGIKIIIKDNGTGMTPEVKKHIFDPFFSTKEVGKGTGLGLSISYGIIEQHHGNIDVISESGKGTEFIISLPQTQPD